MIHVRINFNPCLNSIYYAVNTPILILWSWLVVQANTLTKLLNIITDFSTFSGEMKPQNNVRNTPPLLSVMSPCTYVNIKKICLQVMHHKCYTVEVMRMQLARWHHCFSNMAALPLSTQPNLPRLRPYRTHCFNTNTQAQTMDTKTLT